MPGAFLTIVVAYDPTDALTPAGRTSAAYAWLTLAIGAGQSAGIALAGRLAEQPLASAALPAAGAALLRTPDRRRSRFGPISGDGVCCRRGCRHCTP